MISPLLDGWVSVIVKINPVYSLTFEGWVIYIVKINIAYRATYCLLEGKC